MERSCTKNGIYERRFFEDGGEEVFKRVWIK